MFGEWDDRVGDLQIDAWECRLTEIERQIARLRGEESDIIRHLDGVQVDTADGARTMGDWTAAQFDLSHQTASRLMTVANADDPEIDAAFGLWKVGIWTEPPSL